MEKPVISKALSWNTHALLTWGALASSSDSGLERQVPVVPIEELFPALGSDLGDVIRRYGAQIAQKSRVHVPNEPPERIRTVDEFLRALRVNPNTKLQQVRVLKPDEVPSDAGHDPSRDGPPGGVYVPVADGERIPAIDILATYSDEPDWLMDQDLFLIAEYGYGPIPYGPPTGLSSQAPFHLAFSHENPLLKAILPRLRTNFVEERVRLFFGLAQPAFAAGIDYWGWRFTAWGMHYLQDMTQPYHAKIFPFPLWRVLLRVIRERDRKSFAERNKNLLRNRHLAFEGIIHFLLNEASKKDRSHALLRALKGDDDFGAITIPAAIELSTRKAARAAIRANAAMEALMQEPRLNDPEYFLADDHTYRIEETLPKAAAERPQQYQAFIKLVCESLRDAGRITRYCIRRLAAV
ncbi:MAG: hypothetical protein AB1473_09210 [Thermodesulfobacteriota bacterium]